jgi:hypothetical protein
MRFNSKAHMTRELLSGKRFKNAKGVVIYYDANLQNPFRCGLNSMDRVWEQYNEDIWEEIKPQQPPIIGGAWDLCQRSVAEEAKPRHVHQDLIDSYQDGQVWQYRHNINAKWLNLSNHSTSWQPDWEEDTQYRLHPHNDLIQAHRNGAKIQAYICGDWIEEPNPDWYEDTKYRIAPTKEFVLIYEWKFKTPSSWMIEVLLMSEKDAKVYFEGREYKKTGRYWEVEV